MHSRVVGTLLFMGAAVVLIALYAAVLSAIYPKCPRFSDPQVGRTGWVCTVPAED